MNSVLLDLPSRTERRYILLASSTLFSEIASHFEQVKFSKKECVQTFYFNTDDHIVPFEDSIKARRYLLQSTEIPELDESVYFLDLKHGEGVQKEKRRLETTLRGAIDIISKEYPLLQTPLRPYVCVQYARRHFVPRDGQGVRITVDDNVRYFFFPPSANRGIELGCEEGYSRLEIKSKEPSQNVEYFLEGVLRKLRLSPIISKKGTAYNLLSLYHVRTAGRPFYKELINCEIEAKLESPSEGIFREVQHFFQDGKSHYILPPHFPFTFESASINRYYRGPTGSFKAMLRREEVEIVEKSETEVVKDPYDLHCISKRRELKGQFLPIDSQILVSAELQGELYRMRKAFWVENPTTGRFYHVSLDLCLGAPGKLYEMEIEYTGRYGQSRGLVTEKEEEEITADIAEITYLLVKNFPVLKPSQLTKADWLGVSKSGALRGASQA